ncbi:hypothetical protein MKJ04_07555 [Pontibacter sp. E15-1]|uniref:hypothetical protein n=1 Tax=Pontibacter sp. E15-1 TaxID=2919918 RepID=UPI001F4F7844|nr:hypothetical protein [Pontibacter sp. E15-1]MCJ8164694.1 hypothetical protein [Pontibacter sp. E15-1]
MTTELNLKRLSFFLRRQLYLNVNTMWIAIVAVLGVLLIVSALFAYFNPDPDTLLNLRNLYLVVFMLGGYIFTSKVFDEMHAPQKSYMFLTLPVSAAEKLLAAWFVTSPVYVLVFGLIILLLSFFSSLVAGNLEAFPYLFDKSFFVVIRVYLVTQAIFVLGATAFRGNNFLKTLLALIVAALLISAYTGGLGYLLFGQSNYRGGPSDEFKDTAEYIFTKIIPMLFWWLFAPFMLLVSYFKLKERQV